MGKKAVGNRDRRASGKVRSGSPEGAGVTAAMSSLDWIWAGLAGSFFILLPFVVSTAGYESFDVPKNSFLFISVAFLALFGLLSGRLKLFSPVNSVDLLILGSFGYLAAHTLAMGRIITSWQGVMGFFALVLLYFILRSIPSRKFHQYIWIGIAVSMSLNALFTILQQFEMFPLMVGSGRADASDRLVPAGFIGEVNRGGFLFALTLIMLLYFLFCGQGWRNRLRAAALVPALFILSGLAFTRTMTSILGLAACLALWLIFHNWYLLRKKRSPLRNVVVFWLIVLVGITGIIGLGYRAGVADRIEGLADFAGREAWIYATSGRTPLFFLTWEMIKESPVTGNGLNSFPVDFFKFKTETEIGRSVRLMPQPGAFKEVHNEYLQTWLELGLPGLVLLLLLFFVPFYHGARFLFRDIPKEDIYWIGMLLLGLVFTGITCLAFFPLHLAVTAPYICLLIAGVVRFSSGKGDPVDNQGGYLQRLGRSRGLKYAFIGITVLFSIWAMHAGIVKWKVNKQAGMASYIMTRSMSEPLNQRQKMLIVGEALHLLDEADGNNTQLPEIKNLKGTGYLLSGRYENAVNSFQEAIRLAPSPETYVNLAAAYLALGRDSDAVECLRTAGAYDMENMKVMQLMWHMWNQGNFNRQQSLQLIEDLEEKEIIGPRRKAGMLKDLRDRGLITSREYSDMSSGEGSRESRDDENRN